MSNLQLSSCRDTLLINYGTGYGSQFPLLKFSIGKKFLGNAIYQEWLIIFIKVGEEEVTLFAHYWTVYTRKIKILLGVISEFSKDSDTSSLYKD